MGVTKILFSFKLVLEGKIGKETSESSRLEFKEFSANNFALSDAEGNTQDFSLWYKRKKWFLWTLAVAQAAENHGDEWGLTWYFLCGIYTSIPTWTHSQNSLAAAEALSLKISSHGTFLKWSRRLSQSARILGDGNCIYIMQRRIYNACMNDDIQRKIKI